MLPDELVYMVGMGGGGIAETLVNILNTFGD